jgi:hypothetical protein
MNFEAVGPERLVLVARDPWIAAPCVRARVCHNIFSLQSGHAAVASSRGQWFVRRDSATERPHVFLEKFPHLRVRPSIPPSMERRSAARNDQHAPDSGR